MIEGFFLPHARNVPVVPLIVGSGDKLASAFFVLDTGFTGDLKVNKYTAGLLGLTIVGSETMTTATGHMMTVPVAIGQIVMQGVRKDVSVLIEDGSQLAGIGLLTKFGFKVEVDCRHRTVTLTKSD